VVVCESVNTNSKHGAKRTWLVNSTELDIEEFFDNIAGDYAIFNKERPAGTVERA
jgi:hypothetical protein